MSKRMTKALYKDISLVFITTDKSVKSVAKKFKVCENTARKVLTTGSFNSYKALNNKIFGKKKKYKFNKPMNPTPKKMETLVESVFDNCEAMDVWDNLNNQISELSWEQNLIKESLTDEMEKLKGKISKVKWMVLVYAIWVFVMVVFVGR